MFGVLLCCLNSLTIVYISLIVGENRCFYKSPSVNSLRHPLAADRLPKPCTLSPQTVHLVSSNRALRLPKPCTSSPQTVHFVSRNRALRLLKPCTLSPKTVHRPALSWVFRLPKPCT